MSETYEHEEWVRLYQRAMLELEQAKMRGRIGDARTEIAARLEKLREIPILHTEEKRAIEDALTGLRILEREDDEARADERRIAEAALEKLRIIGPKLAVD
jgi:hypothetical protein